jgi:uncharacterized protein YcaQ
MPLGEASGAAGAAESPDGAPPAMPPPVIRNAEARRLFLAGQGLSRPPNAKLTDDGLRDLVDDLGFVQVDSINTVERAHHMILFSRNQTYKPARLTRLLERDAALFENWTHDAAIIPSCFYPFWKPRFARERAHLRDRWRKWRRDGFEEMLDEVLGRVRDHGPVMARHLGDGRKKEAAGWWDWHPSKTALEYRWRTGELAVARREGFQKVYDLAERVIPARHLEETPTDGAFVDWACRGALERLGTATSGELAAFWGGITPAEAAGWCRDNLGNGVVEVAVEGTEGGKPRPAYAQRAQVESLSELPSPPGRIRVLSPFDPVLRDRARTERLFGFRYRIEVFVPAAKRQYGYYVFPLLEGERLIGRIDMTCERQAGRLRVKGLWLEPGIRFTRKRQDTLAAELERLRRFTGAERVARDDGYVRAAG